MNMKLKSLRTSATLIVLLAVSLLTFSCNSFDERLPECRLLVKFKYDYNMLHTDAFHTQVDRVELYIFDKDVAIWMSIWSEVGLLKKTQ